MTVQINDALSNNGSGGVQATGSIASRLMQSGFNVNALRPAAADDAFDVNTGQMRSNATLRIREWILYDTAVIDVARRRLVGVQDLINAGLTYEVADALGITRIEWEKISVMTPAEVSMSGISQTANDRQEYSTDHIPLPIIHKDFQINIRQLYSSRRLGTPLDVTQAQLASRLVSETIETMLFAGATVLGSNNPIYGYTTYPNRNTGSVTAAWLSASGTSILNDVLAMQSASIAKNMYGPWALYVPQAVYTALGNDFKTNGDRTVLERLLAIPGITSIAASKDLTASNVLLIQMSSDVVDEVIGMEPTTVQWETQGGLVTNFKVMAIMVPRLKADYTTQCGITHFS